MALDKVDYVDGETVIYADNLNDIQDEIIANAADIATKEEIGKLTIGNTEYEVVISNTDAGQAGKIVFYIEE